MRRRTRAGPSRPTVGTPTEFLPPGQPDAILARLGLDAAGIAAPVLEVRAGDRTAADLRGD